MTGTGSSKRTAAALAALVLLAACATNKQKNIDEPAELTKFTSTVKVQQVWSAKAGTAEPKLRLGLAVATDGTSVYAAGHDGQVIALDAASGRKLWQTKTKLKLTGGPGVGEGLVVAGTSYGDIVALDAATGVQKWKAYISSEVLAPPAIGGGVVVMRMVDGRVVGLKVADGSQLWSAEPATTVPKLSLRGTSRPVIVDDVALCGFDTGRVMALSLRDGTTLWDVSVAPPSGKSEVDRLNDIDSAVRVLGSDVYAVTYQGKAAHLNRETGQAIWSRDISSYAGLAIDEGGIYISSSSGALVRLDRTKNGVEMWKQEVLEHRRLSPPAVLGAHVAVADLDGYVHFFDAAEGQLAGRIHALGGRVTAVPLVVGDLLIMMDDKGKIVALRITPIAAKS
jgi:outer membrane protein assembly factor BamB